MVNSKRIKELEKENRNLKEDIEILKAQSKHDYNITLQNYFLKNRLKELEKENNELKEKLNIKNKTKFSLDKTMQSIERDVQEIKRSLRR